jgi:antitoxin HicB
MSAPFLAELATPQDSRMINDKCAPSFPALTEAKLALYSAMRAERITKSELARRLNCHLPQVDRLLDLPHGSPLDQLEPAFRALGKQRSVEISGGNRSVAN